MKTYNGITVVSPLLTKKIKRLGNYYEWLKAFEKADDDDALMGYLHTGFGKSLAYRSHDEPRYSEGDRIIFYLSHADGWVDGEGLEKGGASLDSHRFPTPSERCMSLAKKAITMLCTERFKAWVALHPYENDFADEVYISKEVLPVLMYFFSEEQKDGTVVPRNGVYSFAKDSHIEDILRKFLLKLIKVILSWQPKERQYWEKARLSKEANAEIDGCARKERERMNKAKTWATKMLVSLNEIKVFHSTYRDVPLIDSVVVSALEEVEGCLKISKHHISHERIHEKALKAQFEVAWLLEEYYVVNNCRPKVKVTQRLRSKFARR